MRPTSVSKRYARALMQLCNNDLQVAKKRLSILKSLEQIYYIPKIKKILISPSIPKNLKINIIHELINYCGGKEDINLKKYFEILIEKKRMNILIAIIYDYEVLINKMSNLIPVEVVFASNPSSENLSLLKKILEEKLAQEVIINHKINPNIIGGLIVNIQHKVIDLSIKTKLKSLFKHIVN